MTIACFYKGGPVQEQLENIGVRTFNLDLPSERDPRAILRARRLIETISPDVVHTHLLRADLYGSMGARLAGVPMIISTVYAMGNLRHASNGATDRLLDAACARLPKHLIAVSHAVKDDCVYRLGLNPRDVSVIHTGIDLPRADASHDVQEIREQFGVQPREKMILTIARLSHEKGIDTLIDAAALSRDLHPDAKFVILGEGTEHDALASRITERELNGCVIMAGFQENIWPALAAADLVCIPSHSEGLPNVLLEAMAAEKPIVATNVGGIPEAVTDEHDCLLIPPNHARMMSLAICRLLNDRSLADRLGRAARQSVEARFLARDAVRSYESLYNQLLHRNFEHAPLSIAH
jgi:glycosyltransferase involved in cell wall biosynthesis